jgi:hypothetical protein
MDPQGHSVVAEPLRHRSESGSSKAALKKKMMKKTEQREKKRRSDRCVVTQVAGAYSWVECYHHE